MTATAPDRIEDPNGGWTYSKVRTNDGRICLRWERDGYITHHPLHPSAETEPLGEGRVLSRYPDARVLNPGEEDD